LGEAIGKVFMDWLGGQAADWLVEHAPDLIEVGPAEPEKQPEPVDAGVPGGVTQGDKHTGDSDEEKKKKDPSEEDTKEEDDEEPTETEIAVADPNPDSPDAGGIRGLPPGVIRIIIGVAAYDPEGGGDTGGKGKKFPPGFKFPRGGWTPKPDDGGPVGPAGHPR
jgi:hypothetical protein